MKKFDMKKFTFVLIGINIIFFIFISTYYKPKVVNSIDSGVEQRDVYLNIITTNKFIYNSAKQIVKDKHNVSYMFNNRNDSMNFKFSNDSLDNVSKYDLLLYMGTSAEPWINDFIDGLKKGKVGIVNLSRGTRTLNYTKPQNINDYEIKINPYYWLSPDEYKIFLYNLKSAIQDKDPKNREFYEQNYKEVADEFDKITNDLKDASSVLQDYKIYTTDDDLDYIIKYLGINATKITDLSKVQDYEKDFNKDSSKNLILYSDEEKFRTFKKRLSGVTYSDMEIKIPEYSDKYKDFFYNLISKFKALAEKS